MSNPPQAGQLRRRKYIIKIRPKLAGIVQQYQPIFRIFPTFDGEPGRLMNQSDGLTAGIYQDFVVLPHGTELLDLSFQELLGGGRRPRCGDLP